MKVRLTEDEWYPVLTPEERKDWQTAAYWKAVAVDVPDELVLRWRAASDEMHAACEALRPYHK